MSIEKTPLPLLEVLSEDRETISRKALEAVLTVSEDEMDYYGDHVDDLYYDAERRKAELNGEHTQQRMDLLLDETSGVLIERGGRFELAPGVKEVILNTTGDHKHQLRIWFRRCLRETDKIYAKKLADLFDTDSGANLSKHPNAYGRDELHDSLKALQLRELGPGRNFRSVLGMMGMEMGDKNFIGNAGRDAIVVRDPEIQGYVLAPVLANSGLTGPELRKQMERILYEYMGKESSDVPVLAETLYEMYTNTEDKLAELQQDVEGNVDKAIAA